MTVREIVEIRVALVAGPPGSGKTTLVRARRRPGDLVLDLDEIFGAITAGDPHELKGELVAPARSAQLAVLGWWHETPNPPRLWVVSTAFTEQGRRRALRAGRFAPDRAILVSLEVDPVVCMRRIVEEGRPDEDRWRRLVTEWWDRFEPPIYGERWIKGEVSG